MMEKINGQSYRNMLDYGVRYLNMHCKMVNRLNVFPVPDGDTGTNMVTTIKNGLLPLDDYTISLSEISKKFAEAIVFGARGNSGVIVSQFFKGVSEQFFDVESADPELLIKALEKGVEYSRNAVSKPVEGTILTVVRDATEAVKNVTDNKSIDEVLTRFIKHAKISLENTPELLPALKEAGVVDSGGAGIVYIFEGMKKFLDGEELDTIEAESQEKIVDYSVFNTESSFDFGYCTELLIQTLKTKKNFERADFEAKLQELGDSVVLSVSGDKIRLHIHTKTPEKVFEICHLYGEFLSIKVENMTVQHSENTQNILCSPIKNNGEFAVVAVASDKEVQKLFADMGADVVICCDEGVSTRDYIEAFKCVSTKEILVFPNSSDATLSAIQAKNIYKDAEVTVINSRSVSECYASLPIIDFEQTDIRAVVDEITETINKLYVVSVVHKDNSDDSGKNEYYAFSGKEVVAVNKNLYETVIQSVKKIFSNQNKEIITIFHCNEISKLQMDEILSGIRELSVYTEIYTIKAANLPCVLTMSFE